MKGLQHTSRLHDPQLPLLEDGGIDSVCKPTPRLPVHTDSRLLPPHGGQKVKGRSPGFGVEHCFQLSSIPESGKGKNLNANQGPQPKAQKPVLLRTAKRAAGPFLASRMCSLAEHRASSSTPGCKCQPSVPPCAQCLANLTSLGTGSEAFTPFFLVPAKTAYSGSSVVPTVGRLTKF